MPLIGSEPIPDLVTDLVPLRKPCTMARFAVGKASQYQSGNISCSKWWFASTKSRKTLIKVESTPTIKCAWSPGSKLPSGLTAFGARKAVFNQRPKTRGPAGIWRRFALACHYEGLNLARLLKNFLVTVAWHGSCVTTDMLH